jgi:hypothetical protein
MLALALASCTATSGCVTTLGYVPEMVKARQIAPNPTPYKATYPQVKEWALSVADGLDSRSTMARQSLSFGALLAGAAAATVTALGAFSAGSPAIVGIPIGTAFLSTGATIYNSEPKAVIYRYASDTVKELVRKSDERIDNPKKEADKKKTADQRREDEALCLQGNVYAVMRRVGHHIALLDPKNVSDRLKAVGSTDAAGLQKLAADVTTDFTDLRRVSDGCPLVFAATPASTLALAPGGTTVVTVEGGESPYSATAQDAPATVALTVSPPVSEGDTAKMTIKVNDGARPGHYGVLIKDSAGSARVVVVSVEAQAVPTLLKASPVLGALYELIPRKGEAAGFVISGGTRPYTSLGPAAGSEGAIEVTPIGGQSFEPPDGSIVTITLTDKARAGMTYVARVRDKNNQVELLPVRVKAAAPLRIEPLGRALQQPARPRDTLFFVLSGGTPPYKAFEAGGQSALTLDPVSGISFERPALTVRLNENARAGQLYFVTVEDAQGASQQVMIPVQAGETVIVVTPDVVRRVQTRLKALGYDQKAIDGVVGDNTRAALRSFQRDKGLDVTGEVDGPTLRALMPA